MATLMIEVTGPKEHLEAVRMKCVDAVQDVIDTYNADTKTDSMDVGWEFD